RHLPHVDALERLHERDDDDEPRLVRLAVLAQVLHDADLALLDHVHRLAEREDQHDDDERDDGQDDDAAGADGKDHGCSSEIMWPSTGHTTSVVPSTAVTST